MTETDPQDQTILDQPGPGETAEGGSGELAQLSKFLRRYARGERIFEQGDEGDTMYFIQQGRVQITKVTPRRIQPLAILEPGSFFGEMAVISGEPRSARAEALDECMLLEIDREILDDFLRSHPNVAQRMIRILAERLRKTDELVERLLEGDPMIQVVDAILDMTKDSAEVPPYVRDVHQLMVQSATDTRTLRWVLTRLRRARFLDVDDEGLRISQRARLEQYLNFLQMQQDLLAGGDGRPKG
ncbi:MAG: hypothetical protein D6761_11010 [Candidatus Dadabacteria bacterium]|nr:MAG: hypothetical protein D6761_11010 [Candidatus Dadabacteria bacterium]